MLVDPDDRAIDEDELEIGIIGQCPENPLPDALLRPPPKARVHCDHLPKASGRSRQGEPVRAIHRTASTNSRLSRPLRPGSPGLPDSSGAMRPHCTSLNTIRIKADLQFSALN